MICAATRLTKRHLDAAPKLRLVHHQGVGWQDTTDWQEIKRRGLPLAMTTAGTTIGVAELLLMLAAAKRLAFADAELRRGRWHVNALRGVSDAPFETDPADNIETLRLVDHAYWAAGQRGPLSLFAGDRNDCCGKS